MSESTKQKLFRYLQGEITFDEYQQQKQKDEAAAGTPVEGDVVMGSPEASSEGGVPQADGENVISLNPDKKTTMIMNYIKGQITFEEFDQFLERGESDMTEEPTDNVVELNQTEEEPTNSEVQASTSTSLADVQPSPKTRKPRGRKALPKDLQGLMGEANLRFAHGEYDEAIKMCLEVIRLVPTAPEPFQTLGMLYEETGDMEKSLQYSLIAAHLDPKDAEEWARVAEMSLAMDNIPQAVTCLSKAIKYAPENVSLVWERAKLYEAMGETKKVIENYLQILQILPPGEGEQYFVAARHLVELCHPAGETEQAVLHMQKAFDLYPSFVNSEYVNLLTELYISLKKYETVLELIVKHCGVQFVFPDEGVISPSDSVKKLVAEAEDDSKNLVICSIPDALPIDLRVKLIITLIFMSRLSLVPKLAEPVYTEDVEEFGDLFLDISEAFIEKGCYAEAKPVLQKLVDSNKYHVAPAVWLKYAECLSSVGMLQEAAVAYKQVVDLVPSHYDARVSLSLIQQQLGLAEEALETLNHEEDTAIDYLDTDPCLLLHRCHLLLSQKQYDEYYKCSKTLLFGHLKTVLAAKSAQLLTVLPRSYKHRRDMIRYKFGSDYANTPVYSMTSSVSNDDLWEIFMKSCQTFFNLKQFDRLLEFSRSCQVVDAFMRDPFKMKEAQFISCVAFMKTADRVHAADIARIFVSEGKPTNVSWNFYTQALMLSEDNRHNKFVNRLYANDPENLALKLLNAHCSLLTSFYKRSLHDYFAALRQNPSDPMINLCVGLSFLNLASQQYAAKRHALVLQSIAFFNRYREFRGECQEVYYNMGRAMHQMGLLHAAVFYYQKVLSMKPAIEGDQMFDLKREAAFNLCIVYRGSGSLELASLITQEHLVV